MNELVGKALDDARVQLGLPSSVPFDALSLRPLPSIDLSIPEAHIGFWSGVLGFMVNPAFGLVSMAVSWLIGFKVGESRRRARVLKKLSEEFNAKLSEAHGAIFRQAFERFHAGSSELLQQVEGRLSTFVRDAERRIERLGRPLTTSEGAQLEQARTAATGVREELDLVAEELRALLT